MKINSSINTSQPITNTAILVVSCDAYKDLWHPFFQCFFKYWPDCPFPIYLGSNISAYNHQRVTQILIGEDKDYSSNLLAMLKEVREDWVIFWIEDRVLSETVDTQRLMNIIGSAIGCNAAYCKLISSHPFSFADSGADVGEVPSGSKYRVCMTVALWNKESLEKILIPGESAWEIERSGSDRSNKMNAKFMALTYKNRNKPPIRDMHLIIKGRLLLDAKKFLVAENLINDLSDRKFQSLLSYIYVKAYLIIKGIVAAIYYSINWFRRSLQ